MSATSSTTLVGVCVCFCFPGTEGPSQARLGCGAGWASRSTDGIYQLEVGPAKTSPQGACPPFLAWLDLGGCLRCLPLSVCVLSWNTA